MNQSEIQKAFCPWSEAEIEAAFNPWGILKQSPSNESEKPQEKIKEEPQPKPWDAVLGNAVEEEHQMRREELGWD